MPAPVPGTVPDTFVQDNGLGYQVVPTTVEQNGGTTSNWLLGGAHFVDSWSSGDAWRIKVPDTSSEEETGHDEETIATDPGVDGARNSQECDDDDIVIPGTPEPSSGRRMKRLQFSAGKPSKINFSNISVSEPREDSSLRGADNSPD